MKKLTLVLAGVSFFVCLNSWAQDMANIVGTVSDTSGAVIPGAKITVSNPDKAYTRELVVNSAGEYTAARVPIGDYVITAEAPGFQKLLRTGISVSIGQTLRVDLQLTVGQLTQEITVSGNATKVETETGAISDVVTGKQIDDLTLNGRNFIALYTLVPGAAPDNSFDATHLGHLGAPLVSFNGLQMQFSNMEIDGGSNLDEACGGSSQDTTPALDSIAEFRISTSNYGADMGKHAGAVIQVATKSGTKDFHGILHEFFRNDKLDANDWFVNRQINPTGGDAPKRPLKINTFGYTFGGPFYIPGRYNTDKSKTFFYWSHAWAKYRDGVVINTGAPSLRMREGDFSECDSASPNFNSSITNCTLPIDPTTGQLFPGDIVPVNPNGKALLDGLVPTPNNGVVGYVAAPTVVQNFRQEQLRVDQNISDKTSIFVRYTQDTWGQVVIPTLWSYASYDTVKTPFNIPAKSAVVHLTHSFRPTLLNEFLMSYANDYHEWFAETGPSSPAGSIFKPPSWTAKNLFPPNANNPLLPGIVICGGTPFCVGEDANALPWYNSNPVFTWKDTVAYTAGKHSMKFGFFVQRYRKNESFGFETQGYMRFQAGGSVTSGNALADLQLGRIQQYTEGTLTQNGIPVGGNGRAHWRMTSVEPFFQDDWKVSRKLTLNLGARYYVRIQMHDVTNPTVDSTFVPNLYNSAAEAQLDSSGNIIPGSGHDYTTYGNGLLACGVEPIPPGCQAASYWTMGPRFGFAYDPTGSGKTSIRGGYGLYFEIDNSYGTSEGLSGNPPITLTPSSYNINGYQNVVPGAYGPANINTIPSRGKYTQIHQFSLGVQHEFRGNNLLSVSYVGSQARHLSLFQNLNQVPIGVGIKNVPVLAGTQGCDASGNCDVQDILINNRQPSTFFAPYRGYGSITSTTNTGVSHYDALQANYRHSIGHGLTFQAAYTWSHAIDDASGLWQQSGVDDSNMSRWRATGNLNRTHILVMNYIYELPFLKNAPNGFVKTAFGGWQISGITSFFTGTPVDFLCGVSGFSNGIGQAVRCNPLAKLKVKKGIDNDPEFGPTPTWFDPSAFGQVRLEQLRADGQPGMFGYMGRNPLTGPGRNNWDLALLKNFGMPWFKGERSSLQFRLETFNTFNHPQWKSVNAGCGGGTPFGEPCSGNENNRGNGQVSGAFDPRIVQLGLKMIF